MSAGQESAIKEGGVPCPPPAKTGDSSGYPACGKDGPPSAGNRVAMTGDGAIIDATGAYRYLLWRSWSPRLPSVTFIMLNPSTADAESDDPTLRRCRGLAKHWGYGRLVVVNLFAYRATKPADLQKASAPTGPENRHYIDMAVQEAGLVVAAWGCGGARWGRDKAVLRQLPSPPSHLGLTKDGHPRHPLYVPSGTRPTRWEEAICVRE